MINHRKEVNKKNSGFKNRLNSICQNESVYMQMPWIPEFIGARPRFLTWPLIEFFFNDASIFISCPNLYGDKEFKLPYHFQ